MKEVFKKTKNSWPTKAAMEQVYERKLWGDNNSNFYSGSGSHQLDIVKPYIATVISFVLPPLAIIPMSDAKTFLTIERLPYI